MVAKLRSTVPAGLDFEVVIQLSIVLSDRILNAIQVRSIGAPSPYTINHAAHLSFL